MAQDTLILSARQQRTEKISGRFFTVISATAKFTVELDGRIRREVRAGSKITAEPFKRISFIETEGLANTIVFDAGDEQYDGEVQVSGVSNETFDYAYFGAGTETSGEQRISNGSYTSLPLLVTISGVVYTRKSFHIGIDASSGSSLGIFTNDASPKLLDQLSTRTDRTFFFTQNLKLKAIGSTDVIITCYYTLFNTTPQ